MQASTENTPLPQAMIVTTTENIPTPASCRPSARYSA